MPDVLPENASLRDRVESLRLPGKVDDPRRGGAGGWLAWVLVLLLAAGTASLAARVYTGQVPASQPGSPAAAATGTASKDNSAAPAPPGAAAKPAAPAAGSTVLEAKGYI